MLLILAVGLVPAFGIQIYNQVEMRREREREIAANALRQAELVRADIVSILAGARQIANVIAGFPAVQELSPDCRVDLERSRPFLRPFIALEIRDAAGGLVCSTLENGRPLAQGPELAAAAGASNEMRIGRHAYEPGGIGRYLSIALPLPRVERGARAALVAAFDLDWLGGYLERLDHPPKRTIVVADREGTIIARYPEHREHVGNPFLPSVMPLVGEARPGNALIPSFDGLDRLIGYIPPAVAPGGIWTSVGYVMADLTADIERAAWRGYGLIVVGALFAGALAYVTGVHVVRRPTEALLAAVERWRAGDFTARAKVPPSGSELHQLAGAYNEMAAALVDRDARTALIVRELNHRMKNTLATVLAVVQGSSASARSVSEYRENLRGRIEALARVQALTADDGVVGSIALDTLLRGELAPFEADRPPRLTLAGPPIELCGEALRAAGLAFHELATNAAKYGALSRPEGHIAVTWREEPGRDGAGRMLAIAWEESGGPTVRPPARQGFGSRLLQTLIERQLRGRIAIAFPPAGIRVDMSFALGEPQRYEVEGEGVFEPSVSPGQALDPGSKTT